MEWVVQNLNTVLEIVLKLGGQKGFQVLPKRWVVKRTFALISRNRRLARDYERLVEIGSSLDQVCSILGTGTVSNSSLTVQI